MYPRATACLLRSNCTSPLQNSLAAALKNHGAFKHMSTPSKGLEYVEVDAQAVLVPPHWVLPLLEEIDNAANLAKEEKGITLNAEKIALLLTPGPSTLVSEVRKSRNGKQSAGTDDGAEVSSLDAVRHMQRIYLSKAIARRKASNATTGARPVVLSRLYRNLYKHSSELYRMRDPKHSALVPLVEAALTIMRLSCERWFGLVGVYVGYLIFLDPPPVARKLITVVARLSRVFQRGILLSFPAVCWAYGAGMVFSSFASVIFWTGPVLRAVEQLRSVATEVQPQEWHPATPQELDRMGSSCAICWGSLTAAPGDGAPASMPTDAAQGHGAIGGGVNASAQGPVQPIGGVRGASAAMGLPCSHAYHRQCLLEWLQACYSQSRTAICPMCQVEVPLQVRYRVPLTTGGPPGANAGADGGGGGRGDGGAVGEGVLHRRERGIPGLDALVEVLHEDFQHRFEQPIGPLHFAAEGGEVEVAQAEGQQEGPPPDAPPLVAAVAHGGDEADANDTAVGANNSPAANVSRREQEEVMLGSSEQVQVAGSGSGAGGALPVEGDRPRERRRRGLLHRLFNRRRPRIQ